MCQTVRDCAAAATHPDVVGVLHYPPPRRAQVTSILRKLPRSSLPRWLQQRDGTVTAPAARPLVWYVNTTPATPSHFRYCCTVQFISPPPPGMQNSCCASTAATCRATTAATRRQGHDTVPVRVRDHQRCAPPARPVTGIVTAPPAAPLLCAETRGRSRRTGSQAVTAGALCTVAMHAVGMAAGAATSVTLAARCSLRRTSCPSSSVHAAIEAQVPVASRTSAAHVTTLERGSPTARHVARRRWARPPRTMDHTAASCRLSL